MPITPTAAVAYAIAREQTLAALDKMYDARDSAAIDAAAAEAHTAIDAAVDARRRRVRLPATARR